MRALRRKQQAERARQEAELEAARSAAIAAVQTASDMAALQQVVDESGALGGDVGEAIEVVLRDRHTRETSEMLARQYKQRTEALRLALEDVFDRRSEARSEISSKMQGKGHSELEIEDALAKMDKEFATEQ